VEWDENEEDGGQEFESREMPGQDFSDPGEVEGLGEVGGDDDSGRDAESGDAGDEQVFADSPGEDAPAVPSEANSLVAESTISQTLDSQMPENSADERDRIAHPLRYSSVTGERAPANQFYLPWQPPVAAEKGLASGKEFGTGDSEPDGSSTMPQAEPPQISRGRYVPERNAGDFELAIGAREPAPRQDIGQPLPRVQVIVSLAATRNLFDDALEEASRQMADRFRKLALGEIESAAFRRRAEERAADYRLRGPTF
jgi:hypothetical protein